MIKPSAAKLFLTKSNPNPLVITLYQQKYNFQNKPFSHNFVLLKYYCSNTFSGSFT